MKGPKKCKKNDYQKNNQNSMDEAQLESVQGGTGMPANWKPSDGARKVQSNLRDCRYRGTIRGPIMTLEEKDDWSFYGRNK